MLEIMKTRVGERTGKLGEQRKREQELRKE